MLKIGVLTFSFTIDNYGQVLQYLATQEYLGQKGYKAVLVEPCGWRDTFLRRLKNKIRSVIQKIKNKLYREKPVIKEIKISETDATILEIERQKSEIFKKWAEVTERKEKEYPRRFEQFKMKYFNRQYGTYDDILEAGYKGFCIGSDQTWSGAGWHMMLGWVPKNIKRFSIAPSVGHRVYTDGEIDGFKDELNKFDFVTVREDNGLEMCKRCGYTSAKKILDPTFLLSSSDYEPFIEKIDDDNKPYVFIYLLGGEIKPTIKEIIDFCHSKGFQVKYVESQGRDEDTESIPATVGQWLGLIKNASYVLTNSYHGMAFSIIFHKPFLVFPLVGIMEGMNGRIYNLNKSFSTEDRIYKENLDTLLSPINWNKIDEVIKENRDSLDKLLAALRIN